MRMLIYNVLKPGKIELEAKLFTEWSKHQLKINRDRRDEDGLVM